MSRARRVRVAVVGGGFTGQLVAEALRARRAIVRVGDRDPALGDVVVDLRDTAELRRFVRGADVLVGCAGPFVHTTAALVSAAVTAGAAYVDISGEGPSLAALYGQAMHTASPVVAGMGFEFAVGDLLAGQALAEAGSGATAVAVH